jgi:hypothetical protein
MKKFFLFAAAALMALVGCEKQDQSSLDFANVKQSAKISGQLVYFADKAGAATVETAIAGQRVYFLVAASKYADNAAGNQMFEAISDGEGNFEITVPTGMKAISGQLKTDVIVLGEAPNRIFLKESSKDFTLNAGDAKVAKRVIDIDPVLTACQGTAVLKGQVTCAAGVVKKGDVYEDGVTTAPAGVKVMITAKYEDGDRTLLAETKADGTYSCNVPVPAGKSVDATKIDLAQFDGKYTKEFNNQLTEYDAIYGLAATETAKLEDGKTVVKDLKATAISTIEPTSKTTKFKVKGEIKLAAEELVYHTEKGYESCLKDVVNGSTEYTSKEVNGGAYQIVLVYNEGIDGKEQSLIYDFTAGTKNCQFEEEVAIYDSWKFSDVKIYVKVKKYAVSNYVHYYKTSDGEGTKWVGYYDVWSKTDTKKNFFDSQNNCLGTQELKSAAFTYDGFYDVNVGTLVTTFTMQDDFKNTQLLGVGNVVDGVKIDYDPADQTHQYYGGGLPK